LESPSGKCAKLPTVVASNNRDHVPQSLYYCLFVPHICRVVLRAHSVHGESHIQRNANGEFATSLRLKKNSLEGYRLQVSVTAYSLDNLNIAKKWLSKNFYNSTSLFLSHLQVRNNQNRSENARENFNVGLMTTFFRKISAKCTNFEASTLGVEVFDEI